MRVFCDSNVLIAASVQAHVHHAPAKAVLEGICRGDDANFASTHSLAETFSVLSRMPTVPKLTPQDVLAILEKNIIPHFTLVPLAAADYTEAVRALAQRDWAADESTTCCISSRRESRPWIGFTLSTRASGKTSRPTLNR